MANSTDDTEEDDKEEDNEEDDEEEEESVDVEKSESIPDVRDNDEFGIQDQDLFTQRFKAFDDLKKWKLKSGKYVENVLYMLGMKCRHHNLVHSFILDLTDEFVRKEFDKDEILEMIEKENCQDPELDDDILTYIDSFSKSSTKEIRQVLNTPHPRLGEDYNPKTDFAYEHVRTTVSDWVRLLEMEPNPLSLDMPEAWYRMNVWRTVDIAFSDVPFTYFVGGEKAGLACSERKNRSRKLSNVKPMERKAIGKKGDGYVRTIGSISVDWAASEAGAKWEGAHGTKLMKESGLSMPRTLKDIFCLLAGKIGFMEQKLRKLKVVGYVHAGAVLIRTNLDSPAGYICRYTKGKPLEVYASISSFSKSLDVLVDILYAKLTILQTMKVVHDDDGNANNIARWKRQRKSELTEVAIIPDVHPTPKKLRREGKKRDG
ncbi:hypothetical protein BC936DRAFT_144504 [Jimgerdemannia flammicorona]|uniref:Uncharacterized protein n=1 Tax=Jimgerdemannia flammicorona TaxID=994334 RepID=A0A433DCC0_9FUNG|nr:hypothetical protein BC936DRAFT_144504 [Jimgerdemannia flammicorona]